MNLEAWQAHKNASISWRRPVTPKVRQLLITYALWQSNVWDPANRDDVAAATQWVDHFLEGGVA